MANISKILFKLEFRFSSKFSEELLTVMCYSFITDRSNEVVLMWSLLAVLCQSFGDVSLYVRSLCF